MAAKTSAVTCLVFYIKVVAGYYCDSDKCSDNEYCCGYNLCCKSYKVWDMWYFWCGLLFFMFLLSMCACLWKLRSRSPLIIGGYSYAPLKQEPTYVQTCTPGGMVTGTSEAHPEPQGLPPPYSQPHLSPNKSASPPPAYAHVVAHRN